MRNDTGHQLYKFDTNRVTNFKMADKIAAVQMHGCISSVYISFQAYCISPYASFYAGLSCSYKRTNAILKKKMNTVQLQSSGDMETVVPDRYVTAVTIPVVVALSPMKA